VFEHLDDPQPFAASEGLRAAVVTAGGRLRRRRRRRLVGSGAVAVVAAVVAGGWAYVDRRDAAIDRVEVATQPSVDGAVNILLLGDDGDLAATSREVVGSRVDAAVLVRIDDGEVRILSIPRDLADPIGGERFSNLAAGDLQASVDAVRAVLGDVPIDHVVRLGFDGFVALVDAVGGIPIRVEQFVVDESTGTALEPSDRCQVLDGVTALGLVRSRHVVGDPRGDLGRIERQQVLLRAALDAIDPADVDALSRVVADHAVVDDGLDLTTMLELGRRIEAGPVATDSLPLEPIRLSGGAEVLRLAAGADHVLARYGGPPATSDPASAPLPGPLDLSRLAPC
jgi:LCP family protein required for cell wall assembly